MIDWLTGHVFIAAWVSPIIALAVYYLLLVLGFFIGLYIIVRFIKWAWYRK